MTEQAPETVLEDGPKVIPNASPVPLQTLTDVPAPTIEGAPGKPSETETPDEQQKAEEKKPKVPFSERISQIHAQKKQAEAERSIALSEVARLRAELEKLTNVKVDELPYDQQDSLRVRAAVKAERLEDAKAAAEIQADRAVQARQSSFLAKVEAASDRMPDLVEKFASVPVSEFAADLIADSDKAPEIAYYLANNPREAHEINRMPAHLQGAAIARIEARVSSAPTVRKVSNAPSPPPTLHGGSTPGAKDPGSMTMEEYAAWRSKGNG